MNNESVKGIDLRLVESEDWYEFLEKGGTLGDALDMDKNELESIYALAYEKYRNGSFSEALTIFQLLVQCNHFEAKYYLGLGAARQALKEYKLAGEVYSFAALTHPKDPRFPMHAAECHLALGDWHAAGSGYEVAVYLSKDLPEYSVLHERALKQFNLLKNKLQQSKSTQETTL